MLTTGNQLRAARALAGIEQVPLAEKAAVHVNTIRKIEAKGGAEITSAADVVRRVQAALETLGIEFLNHGEPGVRLRRPRPAVVDGGNPPSYTTDPDEADRGRFR